MLKRVFLSFAPVVLILPVCGQSLPTASRRADLQLGAGFVLDHSNYEPVLMKGAAFYATLDLTPHWGGEVDFRQSNSAANDQVYERTYEVGGRYHRDYGRYSPYVKILYGRGVFNFPNNVANLAYNIAVGGAGLDVHVLPYLNIRADYEYQRWFGFPPQDLQPQVVTIGVAYHFPGGLPRGRRSR